MTETVSHSPASSACRVALASSPSDNASVAALAVTNTPRPTQRLPGAALLLGDGRPTRHLELLTGAPVEVELIAMAPIQPGMAGVAGQKRRTEPVPVASTGSGCAGAARPWLGQRAGDQTEAGNKSRDRQLRSGARGLSADRAELFAKWMGWQRVASELLQQGSRGSPLLEPH